MILSSRTFGEGHSGGCGTLKFSTIGENVSQSVWSHLRQGGARSGDGEGCSRVMRTWSEPVERREVSQPLTMSRSRGLANPRSITEWGAFPREGIGGTRLGSLTGRSHPTTLARSTGRRRRLRQMKRSPAGLQCDCGCSGHPVLTVEFLCRGRDILEGPIGPCGPPS